MAWVSMAKVSPTSFVLRQMPTIQKQGSPYLVKSQTARPSPAR
jgi:hypothetical protein